MERRRLGRHGIEVPALCLGTMTFGLQVDETVSRAILDEAWENELAFLDTSDAYPLGGTTETAGSTEEIIGRWMRDRGNRQDLVLVTKCFAPTRPGLNSWGLSRQHIMDAIDGSLRRLGTDHIDVYLAHMTDPVTPIDETLRAFDDCVRAGKVRYAGCSNYAAWRLGESLRCADRLGITGYTTIQSRYNLLYREIETELLPLCRDQGVGVMVYNPLAGGLLSGKYRSGQSPEAGTRFTLGPAAGIYQDRYWQDAQFEAVETLKRAVVERGLELVSVAVAWVLEQPGVSTAIIGASRPEQLAANFAAFRVEFDEGLRAACEDVWWTLPRRPVQDGYR
jgi:aryl-alcohol dehydrogenase-like predicted oxidoreductase